MANTLTIIVKDRIGNLIENASVKVASSNISNTVSTNVNGSATIATDGTNPNVLSICKIGFKTYNHKFNATADIDLLWETSLSKSISIIFVDDETVAVNLLPSEQNSKTFALS